MYRRFPDLNIKWLNSKVSKSRYDKGLLLCNPSGKKKHKSKSISEDVLDFSATLTNYNRLGDISNKPFISHNSEGWEARSRSWQIWCLVMSFPDSWLMLSGCVLHDRRVRELSDASFIRAWIPFMRISRLKHIPKLSHPCTLTLGHHTQDFNIGIWGQSMLFFFTVQHFFFLVEGSLLYKILFVSAKHQHESAIGIHMSLPPWDSLPSPTPPLPPSRLLLSPCLSSMSDTANFHWRGNI